MSGRSDDTEASLERPLLLPEAIVRVLYVSVGYALLASLLVPLVAGIPNVVRDVARGMFAVAALVVSAGLGPWLLWRMGDRAPIKLVLGGLAGLAAGGLVVVSQTSVNIASWGTPAPAAEGLQAMLVLVSAFVGVAAIGLALFLSRHEGFEDKTMSVDGVLGQPERYSPAASASSVATLVLGIAVLLIVVGVALRLAGNAPGIRLGIAGATFAEYASDFAIQGSGWLFIGGLISLALVGLHRFRRGSTAADSERS
jgi:hypothetical protein